MILIVSLIQSLYITLFKIKNSESFSLFFDFSYFNYVIRCCNLTRFDAEKMTYLGNYYFFFMKKETKINWKINNFKLFLDILFIWKNSFREKQFQDSGSILISSAYKQKIMKIPGPSRKIMFRLWVTSTEFFFPFFYFNF